MRTPNSAAVGLAQVAGAGIRAAALLLTHRNRIWLVLFLLPSKKGMGERGGSGTAFATPISNLRKSKCTARAANFSEQNSS